MINLQLEFFPQDIIFQTLNFGQIYDFFTVYVCRYVCSHSRVAYVCAGFCVYLDTQLHKAIASQVCRSCHKSINASETCLTNISDRQFRAVFHTL